MKMHVVNPEVIKYYIAVDPQNRAVFGGWTAMAEHERVFKPIDIARKLGPATSLGTKCSRLVFHVNGYRMICQYAFGRRKVDLLVCWIGTIIEYNKLSEVDRKLIVAVHYTPPNSKAMSILK
jgi:mRNA interferase HigB